MATAYDRCVDVLELRFVVYRHFVETGSAPTREHLGELVGDLETSDRLLRELHDRHMLVLDDRTGLPIDNGLQFPDEPARHKLLDLIGDLSLVGAPIQADIVATKSGHALAHEMCRRIEAMVASKA